MAVPIALAGINAAATPADPLPLNEDCRYGAQRHPVLLDTRDVALRAQRLLAYGERLHREEAGIAVAESDRDSPAVRPHQTPLAHQMPEIVERQPPPPPTCYPWLIKQKTSGK